MTKPVSYSGLMYPFNELTDRNFEHLVITLFERAIKAGDFGNKYDKAILMPGVGEKGRDGKLLKSGKVTGVIQCKKYQSNLTAKTILDELIKFLINYILFPQLIPDTSNFTYYIVTSKGFGQDAIDLTDSAEQMLPTSNQLPSIISGVISKNSAFRKANLDPNLVITQVVDLASKIDIERIDKYKLQEWLKLHEAAVAPIFFTVNRVIPERLFEEKMVKLEEVQVQIEGLLSQIQLLNQQNVASEDIQLLHFHTKCFTRPAFQDKFHTERAYIDFRQAIADTIAAINTGVLYDRQDRSVIWAKVTGASYYSRVEWQERVKDIVKILRSIQRDCDNFMQSYDFSIAPEIDAKRVRVIETFLLICGEAKEIFPNYSIPSFILPEQ